MLWVFIRSALERLLNESLQHMLHQEIEKKGYRLTRGLITLVNDNHVDNYLKEIRRLYTMDRLCLNRPKIA